MWYEYLMNNVFLKMLYDEIPQLENIDISSIHASHNGPTIRVGFDLAKFADHPPKKWHPSFNTVSMALVFFGIKDLEWKGWDSTNIGKIDIKPAEDGYYAVKIMTDTMLITFYTESIRSEYIEGVCREDRE